MYFRQFQALSLKNLILRKRHPVGTLFEIALPLLIFYLFTYLKSEAGGDIETTKAELPGEAAFLNNFNLTVVSKDEISDLVCYTSPWNTDRDGNPKLSIGRVAQSYIENGVPQVYYSQARNTPLFMCDEDLCSEDQEPAAKYCEFRDISISPSNEAQNDVGTVDLVNRLAEFITSTYLGPNYDTKVVVSSSDSVVTAKIKSPSYSSDTEGSSPRYGFGIVIGSVAPDYSFTVRMNNTESR